jgi:type II secretory ATPase GspE/PulE/Tfp pilus assembly ATPase PilB-like protein
MHARGAAVPVRLLDMGVGPYLVAAGLTCVVAQRLVRTLCRIAGRDNRSRPLLQKLGCSEEVSSATLKTPVGCDECRGPATSAAAACSRCCRSPMPSPGSSSTTRRCRDPQGRRRRRHGDAAHGRPQLRSPGETSLEEVLRAIA